MGDRRKPHLPRGPAQVDCRRAAPPGGLMPEVQDELLAKATAGDAGALADLLTRDGAAARRALHDAIPIKWQSVLSMDDVMQQTYAEAVVSIGRFENRGDGSFAGWLTQLARCTLIDALRMLEADKRGGGR